MQRFEHAADIVDILCYTGGETHPRDALIVQRSLDGWELVSVFPERGDSFKHHMYWKRPTQETSWRRGDHAPAI